VSCRWWTRWVCCVGRCADYVPGRVVLHGRHCGRGVVHSSGWQLLSSRLVDGGWGERIVCVCLRGEECAVVGDVLWRGAVPSWCEWR